MRTIHSIARSVRVFDLHSVSRMEMRIDQEPHVCQRPGCPESISLWVSFPQQDWIKMLERSEKKLMSPMGYLRNDLIIPPGTARRFTFYNHYIFVRMWIRRNQDGSIETTFESGRKDELDFLSPRSNITISI